MPTTYIKRTIGDSAFAFGKKQKIWAPRVLQRLLSKTGQKEQAQAYKILLEALEKAGIKYVPSKGGTSAQFTNVTDATIKKFNKIATQLKADAGLPMSRFQTAEIKKDIKTFVKNKVAKGEYVSRPVITEEFGLAKRSGEALITRALGNKVGPDTYEGGLLNKLGQAEKKAQSIKSAAAASAKTLTESDAVLKAINKEFIFDPDIPNSKEMARNIYGSAFEKAGLAERARLVTQTDNDIMKYLKVLEGARDKPKGMTLPRQIVINDIVDNILTNLDDPAGSTTRKGFRFSPGIIRDYRYSIIDSLLNTKKGTFAGARKALITGAGKELDEVFSVGATHRVAPGYASAIQNIPKKINQLKKTQIDLPFQKILGAMDEGRTTMQWNKVKNVPIEEVIKDFNKTSLGFANKHNVRSPKINTGAALPEDLLASYGPKSQQNIKEVFKKKNYFLSDIKNRPLETMTSKLKESVKGLSKAEQLKYCSLLSKGGLPGNCAAAIDANPIKTAEIFSKAEATTGALSKVKNAATGFLGLLGKGGMKAAPLAAVAAAGAIAEPLVKQFRNDDPTTYMTDENQQKGVLLSLLESETPQVDEEILKWQYPGQVGGAAAAIPGSAAMYKARRLNIGKPKMGMARAALGPVGKVLAGSFSPLGVAASLPIGIAAQVKGGSEIEDIATDPFNWMGPAFASTGAEMATKGMKPSGILAKAMRMGMSPKTLRLISSRFGLPGLALSAGLTGYDWWKNRQYE